MSFARDWQFLRSFFGFHYFRYLIFWFGIVPFAIALLKDVPEQIVIPIPGHPFIVHATLPFNWIFLWICSSVYIAAWAIYATRVPPFVKRYNSYTEYKSYSHSYRWIIWEWYYYLKSARPQSVDILISKEIARPVCDQVQRPAQLDARPLADPEKGKDQTWFEFRRKGNVYRLGLGPDDSKAEEVEKELFWELFGVSAGSRPITRFVIWAMLAIAGMMFLTAVCQHIWTVFVHLGMPNLLTRWGCGLFARVSEFVMQQNICQ